MKTLAQLNIEANKLYDLERSAQYYANHFSNEELLELWSNYCVFKYNSDGKISYPEAYDDEIFDALEIKGYWKLINDFKKGL